MLAVPEPLVALHGVAETTIFVVPAPPGALQNTIFVAPAPLAPLQNTIFVDPAPPGALQNIIFVAPAPPRALQSTISVDPTPPGGLRNITVLNLAFPGTSQRLQKPPKPSFSSIWLLWALAHCSQRLRDMSEKAPSRLQSEPHGFRNSLQSSGKPP